MPTRRSLALLLPLLLALPSAAAAPEKTVARTLPLAPGGVVSVDTYKGSIRVRTWDRAEVAVSAVVVPDEPCDDDAEKVEKTDVVIEAGRTGVSVRTDYDRLPGSGLFSWHCSSRPLVHYELSVPRSAGLRINDYKSDTDVKDLDGDIELETYKGSVDLTGVAGRLELETYKGDVRVETALKKDVTVETYKGEVTFTVPKTAGFDLDARLGRKGHLESDLALPRGSRDNEELQAKVAGGGALLRLKTYKGEFRIRTR